MTQPEALRLADDMLNCSFGRTVTVQKAAAELRRLHAENEALRKTLAAACDEERQQMWEAGPGGGCSRALTAEFQRDALLAALERSRWQWIHSVNAEQCLAAIAKAKEQQ